MGDNEILATCQECKTKMKPLNGQCTNCGSNRIRFQQSVGGHTLLPHGGLRARKKLKGFDKFAKETVSRWKRSGDPKLKDGVKEDMVIDREKDEYHHITRDVKTDEITHEEHEPLSKHKKGG